MKSSKVVESLHPKLYIFADCYSKRGRQLLENSPLRSIAATLSRFPLPIFGTLPNHRMHPTLSGAKRCGMSQRNNIAPSRAGDAKTVTETIIFFVVDIVKRCLLSIIKRSETLEVFCSLRRIDKTTRRCVKPV